MSVHLAWNDPPVGRFALFYLGFRPFFLFGSLAAALLGLGWLLQLAGVWQPHTFWASPALWHGHEMVFGFALAIIGGFLLTAIRNWTGFQTLHRWPLAGLILLWLTARGLNLTGLPAPLAALFDLLFGIGLATAVTAPIVRARQWGQIGLVSKVWLLVIANGFSYAFAHDTGRAQMALLAGVLLVIAVLLTMIHRVLPFFIEKAAQMKQGRRIELPRPGRLTYVNLLLFLAFAVAWIGWPHHWLTGTLAWLLALANAPTLWRWADRVVWHEPLLWSLWGAYAFVELGFVLAGLSMWPQASWLALHAFAAGGIGLGTLGMMARVTLGHTGRNVFEPPRLVILMLLLVLAAALARTLGPLLAPGGYTGWMHASLGLWTLGFGLFWIAYLPMWLRPRVDGRYG
ncbi:NnrS family protein [Sulfurivirga sp.]|uniref:NnrS family protein n=1 Tax=Sulfurivirga sp. TaxID=2614236 RepID=UPI0025CF2E96|nr:NnrS family protein [Sulfurivirga sp.]